MIEEEFTTWTSSTKLKETNMLTFLEGKKTFIIGTLMIILGFLTGNNQMILEGAGFITLRLAK